MDASKVSLKKAVAKLEDGIIVLSGPALAISGIIAGVDLVTGGNILKSIGWLTLAWAITLLLTLDFQVLAFGVRSHHVYKSDRDGWKKALEIVVMVLVAAGISFVSIQMQSVIARVSSVPGLSIEQSTQQLGINPIALIWERSTLVLVLIFMSGWLRDTGHKEPATPPPAVQPAPVIDIDYTALANELEARLRPSLDQQIEGVIRQVEFKISQATGEMQAINSSPVAGYISAPGGASDLNPLNNPLPGKIKALYIANASITATEAAKLAGCSVPTASKWLKAAKGLN